MHSRRAVRLLQLIGVFFILALTATGCGSVRSRLVPMATTPIATPSRGRTEARLRTTVNTATQPAEDPGGIALYLPRAQVEGGVAVRFHEHFALRIQAGTFLDVDAQRIGSNTYRSPGQSGYLVGVAPTLTFPLDSGRTLLAIAPDISLAVVPYVWEEWEYDCPDAEPGARCGGATSDRFSLGFVLGGSVSASRWLDDLVRMTGSVAVRGQPGDRGAFTSDAPTDFGHVAVVLGAEVLFQIIDELSVAIESQWLGVVGPYVVYPSVGVTIGGTFGQGPGVDPRHPDAPPRPGPERAAPTIRPL